MSTDTSFSQYFDQREESTSRPAINFGTRLEDYKMSALPMEQSLGVPGPDARML